ncbi:MAG: 4-(cytidine 5'-diphospho)-2-C-methyl-D-erythritol kinase [Oscillospiraceae bacterium]
MDKLTVLAPAKINLSLDITGVDEKGYHLLDMVMQSVSVFEKVTLIKKNRGITISSNARYVPTDERNVAVKAAMKFFQYTKIQGGVHIHIVKTVPIKAGMAGGSADAAGVIVGLNRMYGVGLDTEQLCEIGLQAGSDVPFMIVGGTKRVQGTGDIILPAPALPQCWIVICMPSRGVSTPTAFANFDTLGEKPVVETEKLIAAIEKKDLKEISGFLGNALERAAQSQDTLPIKQKLVEEGALGSVMTGSGSAIFGIFEDEKSARAAAKVLKTQVKSVFVARPLEVGAVVREAKQG